METEQSTNQEGPDQLAPSGGLSSADLLACPFCGGHPEVYNTGSGSTVECVTPECWVQPSVSLILDPTQKDLPTASEAWNRRANSGGVSRPHER